MTEVFDLGGFRIRGRIDSGWISMIDALDGDRYVARRISEKIVTSMASKIVTSIRNKMYHRVMRERVRRVSEFLMHKIF